MAGRAPGISILDSIYFISFFDLTLVFTGDVQTADTSVRGCSFAEFLQMRMDTAL